MRNIGIENDERIIAGQFMDSFYPAYDGVTVCMDNYAKYLALKDGAFVVASKYKGFVDTSPYDVYRLNGIQIPGLQYKFILPNFNRHTIRDIKQRELDICHSHSPFMAGKIAVDVARTKGIPIVSTFHTQFKSEFYKYTHNNFITNQFVDMVIRYYNRVDEVWAVNQNSADVLAGYGYKKDIFIMHNGTDLHYPDDAASKIKRIKDKHNLTNEEIFLFVGRLTLLKNIDLSIKALQLYRHTGKKFKFFVVGYGDDESKLKKMVSDMNMDDCVVFVGKITDRDWMTGYYLASDLFLFPSEYDNDPLVKKEAAACRTPSILVRGSNSAYDILENENGYLIDNTTPESMFEKITSVMSNRARLQEVSLNAERTIAMPWAKVVDKAYERYGDVIKAY
ncbi:glycosyltransferase [Candidatus Symbiothrix dinenymphae]|uniref:glycosyltransferase n=1 Tax=Candidatus Symbiothrix dinenymphae TaxID=467085 RepID=UPI0006C05699|nr:glycosyltransferase [Candidatus Symbiothrix dinenymphae]GAP73117.1 glycosyltransferase [Candidatus Symbiothrix dinenymphae]